jgi:hypothetical protein
MAGVSKIRGYSSGAEGLLWSIASAVRTGSAEESPESAVIPWSTEKELSSRK